MRLSVRRVSQERVSLRTRVSITALTMAAVLGLAYAQPADADDTGAVSMTVSVEAVGLSITGGTLDLGGPYAPGQYVWAHPSISDVVPGTTPPTVTNSGNVPITYLDVTFDGLEGQEATCDDGDASWAAHASSIAQDRFVLEAWASTNTSTSNFNSSASEIAPSTGSGDVLGTTIEPDASIPLLFRLRIPDPVVAGGEGCTISLTVTAAAE